MLTDPQSLTIAGVASSLPRVSTNLTKSVYMKSDENLTETVSHAKSGDRIRSIVRYDQRIVAADVLTAENKFQTATISILFDRPLVGFTSIQISDLWAAIKTQLDATAVGKIYGQET